MTIPAANNLEGQVLARGRYVVEVRILPSGGMADVYRGRDRKLGTPVAIKVPKQALMDGDPNFRRRFDREVRSMIRLRHPHILGVVDRGTHDGLIFIVLPYLAGGTLRARIEALNASGRTDPHAGVRARSPGFLRSPGRWIISTSRVTSTATPSLRTCCSMRRGSRI